MPTKKTADGKSISMLWPTEGTRYTQITFNWADKTTWYYHSIRVVDEVATCQNSGTWSQYAVASGNMIDTYHGKSSQEDYLKDMNSNSFRVSVKVDDVPVTEQDPHYGSGGDYVVNYASGTLAFNSPLTGTSVVKVTYHYATDSEFVLKPTAGKKLMIRRAEVQFSRDTIINDTVRFQLYIAGNPYGDATCYKAMMDYINEANGAFPVIPAVGGPGWRGNLQDVVTFPWDYLAMTELKSSIAMEVRIKLEHDAPMGGTTATAAFYCLSETE